MTSLSLTERFTIGLTALVVAIASAYLGIQSSLGAFDDTLPVQLVVDGNLGQGLDTFSDVRIRGVVVGSVGGIELGPDGRATVHLDLDPDLDLPASTTANIEPLSVFGPKSIELVIDGGDRGPRLKAGDDVPVLDPPTELSELIVAATDILEAIDPSQIATVQRSLGEGLLGRGGSLNQGIDAFDDITTVLTARDADVDALISDLRTISGELADQAPVAMRAFRSLRAGLPVLSENETQFARLLDDTTRGANEVVLLLTDVDDDLGRLLVELGRVSRVLSSRVDEVVDLTSQFNEFFTLVFDAGFIDAVFPGAPEGSMIAGISNRINEDLCRTVDTLCDDLPAGLLDVRPIVDLAADITELLRLLLPGGGA